MLKQKYWHIEGFDSTTKILDKKVKAGCYSEKQIQVLLKALAAKAGLNFNEIIGAYAKKKTKVSNELLVIHKCSPYPEYQCGDNPHFIARIINENGIKGDAT